MSKRWWIENGPKSDVVLSSRVRLARNFSDIPFPQMNPAGLENVVDSVYNALKKCAVNFKRIDMGKESMADKQFMVEKHLISPALASKEKNASAFVSEDESMSIMVNEEDHIRIQSMASGFDLDKAYETADLIDRVIEETVDYAYSKKYGYLTSCPTNTGTGMRASVMVHLPALCITKNMGKIINSVSKFGIAVRGLYGEGSEAAGNIFQISNQITLGLSEKETINNLKSVVESIIEREQQLRINLREENIIKLADRVWRSYGILKNAQLLSGDEFLRLASDVRLGVSLDIIGNLDTEVLNELTSTLQAAGIIKEAGKELSPEQRDFERAKIVRARL